jgi:hypothetical protein
MAAPRSFEQFLLEGSAYIVTKIQRDGKHGLFLNVDLEHASTVLEMGPADSQAFGPLNWRPALRGAGRAFSLKAFGLGCISET